MTGMTGVVDSLQPFQDAVVAAHNSDAKIDFDDATNNPHFSYMEQDDNTDPDDPGTKHDVWFLDAVTAYNQIHAADIYQPAGYALVASGQRRPFRDPAFRTALQASRRRRRWGRNFRRREDIDLEGEGEILQRRKRRHRNPEAARLKVDKQNGDIDDEAYTKLPTGYVIHQFGAANKKMALHLRRRAGSAIDSEDPRHPQTEGRARHVLRHRQEHGRASRYRSARSQRKPRSRQPYLHPSELSVRAPKAGKAGIERDPAPVPSFHRAVYASMAAAVSG